MRKRKLYLSEYLSRLTTNLDISIINLRTETEWLYADLETAINQLSVQPFWNNNILKHKVEDETIIIYIKY